MEIVNIKAEVRSEVGSRTARAIRREGKIPCVVYGGDKVDYFAVSPADVKDLIYTPNFKLASIEIDGTEHKCIVKDLQAHPVTDEIIHIDFLRLVEGHPLKVNVPVAFKGASPGVKAGGKLVQTMRTVKIKTDPSNLVDKLYVSVSGLGLGQSVRVRDIEPNENIEILSAPATPVAQVTIPRALKSAAAAEKKEGKKK